MSVTREDTVNIVNYAIEKERKNQKEYGSTNKELAQSIQEMMLQMSTLSSKLNSVIKKIDKNDGLREAYDKLRKELQEFKEQYIGNSSRSKGKNEGKNKAFTDIRVWLALALTAGFSAFTVWINLRG